MKITCKNFGKVLSFDEGGTLKGFAFEQNATIIIGGTSWSEELTGSE